MAGLINTLVTVPKGLWENIIFAFESKIANYAVVIILLTLCIKTLFLPLDFFNKKINRKNSKMQALMKPELDSIQKAYANDKALLNQKTSEVYKKNNISMGGSCVFMLVFFASTMVVFLTLFNGLNNMASYKIQTQYESLKAVYTQQVVAGNTEEERNNAIAVEYNKVKDSFLWIDNVWISDSPLKNSVPTFKEYESIARLTFTATNTQTAEQLKAIYEKEYNSIMDPLRKNVGRVNGYFVLVILTVGLAVASQFMARKNLFEKKGEGVAPIAQNKMMLIIMPLILGFFTFFYNSVFSIYIIAGQLWMLATTPLVDYIIFKTENKKASKTKFTKGRIVNK
ncbi:MAG: membrane protein insertase YidC [Clostridia bacterium]